MKNVGRLRKTAFRLAATQEMAAIAASAGTSYRDLL